MLLKRIFASCLFALFLLTGCQSPVYNQTEENVADNVERIKAAKIKSDAEAKPRPALMVNNGLYVDKTPISLAKEPHWLKQHIVLRGGQLPFSYYSRTIVGGLEERNIMTHYQIGLDQSALTSINYSGSVRGALDMLAAKTGYVYNVNGNHVYWQAFITRTYDIAFMPGSSDYMMGKSAGGGGGGTTATGAPTSGILDDSAAAQFSTLKGTLSIWTDLKDSISQMLSPDGKVMVSQSTTSVTVRDRPANIALIGKFIANMNTTLSKQVLVKIQVIEVTLENDYNFGINWNAIQGSFGNGQYQLVSNNGQPISITSATGLATNYTTAGLTINPAPNATGVTSLINALNQQGKVSIVTEPRVLCQNNQVSVIRIVEQEGYLASVQTTSLAGSSSGGQITSQITPGTLVTGVTLYVLPKIMGKRVYLQVNADLSSKVGIQTITSNGSTPGTPAATNSSIIQVPTVTQKQFNQRSVIASGDTLIMSGFKQVSNQAGAQQLLNSQSLGGKGSQELNTETIVLITPIVLPGLA